MAIQVKQKADTSYTGIKASRITKQEQDLISSNALELEDEFKREYGLTSNSKAPIIEPPFNLRVLKQLPTENNTLNQLISAMEVNIDGTGLTIEPRTNIEPNDDYILGIEDFFGETYPGESFVTTRRRIRRDMEATGNGYMEVIRSLDDNIAFLRHLESITMRFVSLDEPVPVAKSIRRFGQDMEIVMLDRERRFAQKVGDTTIYYKEYGSSRDLNKWTGEWADQGGRIAAEERATEVLHFGVIKDATGPYYLPRWINQLPSVLGSRKAEEFNLDFFNSGGVPPFLIFLAGGALTPEVRRQVQSYITGRGSSKNRGGIVEVQPISASLDGGASKVDVTVERFGSEQQKDSMFENYDMQCAKRVAGAFRLPPIFRGMAEDYSFATAFASYTVAEAQVFQPERDEFDEIINNTIMREIAPEYEIRSLPLNVNDATIKLTAITLAAQQGALNGQDLLDALNEVVDLGLQLSDTQIDVPNTSVTVDVLEQPETPALPEPPAMNEVQKSDTISLSMLASELSRKTESGKPDPVLKAQYDTLSPRDKEVVSGFLALKTFGPAIDYDVDGCVELAGAAASILNCECDH